MANKPIAIGGVGGSGTRLVAQFLRESGFHTGMDLNEPGDNLWFTLLFKRVELWGTNPTNEEFSRAVQVFQAVMAGGTPLTDDQTAWVRALAANDRPPYDSAWLSQRAESLIRAGSSGSPAAGLWGWKEPNTHIFIDRLAQAFPTLRYIHVMRNGLDMAYSDNQNQLKLWGPLLLGMHQVEASPRMSLKYWCLVHRRVIDLSKMMPGRFLLLNFDRLCLNPEEELQNLLDFIGLDVDGGIPATLIETIRPPASVGRYKLHGLDVFDADDVEYVRSLGFD